ncbi:nuclear transport factor 2 family protein [Shewanella sp. JM162201]|uniref:Nuclear transport factor 2 family protein n=1 Tax=Shewanella jiangmenensis TaxID=2837387 RepID=A0ABS5V7V2_9GAMM|nr:nuclear transport factor 2 family protein [Shewanella jiangmenensis]MBT1446519.1 nuclear transport factor 2 family protein [Shewanella jiangmenensis]
MKPLLLLSALLAASSFAQVSPVEISSSAPVVAPEASVAKANAPEAVVREFLAAFNQKNIAQMLSQTNPDVYWNHIKGQKVDTKAETQAEFGAALQDYFESLPGAQADILSLTVSGNYVSILEQVSWQVEGEVSSQCSIGVYELVDKKISSIWYYPAHGCEPRDNQLEQPGAPQAQ